MVKWRRRGRKRYRRTAMIRFASTDSRRETGNIKWDLQGPIPFGIADMDIESPPCVVEALQRRLNHHFYGYAYMTDELREAICVYLRNRHGVSDIQPEWLHELPGCVPAFTLVARTVCHRPEHEVLVCTPVYPPMLHCHEDARCRLLRVPYANRDGLWTFDWEAMEAAVTPNTRMFLLCNPHNPLGRVWRRDELEKVADFCERHDLILCSDEIHCDLVLDEGLQHQCSLTLPEPLLQRVVMLSAPSKTFNIAGICFTYMAVPNAALRAAIRKTQGHSLPTLNVFAYAASLAAYTQGWEWHEQLIRSLRANRQTVYDYIAEHLPMLKTRHQEATYLAWIDCSALGVESPHEFFLEKADVYLDNGANFGSPQCVRLNFATSPELLRMGLDAMRDAVNALLAERV